jgi:hypothetical protein
MVPIVARLGKYHLHLVRRSTEVRRIQRGIKNQSVGGNEESAYLSTMGADTA